MNGTSATGSALVQPDIIPIILAGGNGMRLRPLTSPKRPKPFLRLFGAHSLFQDTVLRAGCFGAPLVVCHEDHGQTVLEHLEEIGVWPDGVLLEPDSRNTAAAIALAAFHMKDKDALMLVMPSDHVLPDHKAFQEAVQKGIKHAQNGSIVQIGVKPKSANTRFGYICTDGPSLDEGFKIRRFAEKPDKKTARAYIRSNACFWNTGIFLCTPRVLLEELRTYQRDIYDCVARSYAAGEEKTPFFEPEHKYYVNLMSISIDYAVMERCEQNLLIVLDTKWDDVGCWQALLRIKLLSLLGTRKVNRGYDTRAGYRAEKRQNHAAKSGR